MLTLQGFCVYIAIAEARISKYQGLKTHYVIVSFFRQVCNEGTFVSTKNIWKKSLVGLALGDMCLKDI